MCHQVKYSRFLWVELESIQSLLLQAPVATVAVELVEAATVLAICTLEVEGAARRTCKTVAAHS